jgi:hypothetical protein
MSSETHACSCRYAPTRDHFVFASLSKMRCLTCSRLVSQETYLAYPKDANPKYETSDRIRLRDQFAMAALTGILANSTISSDQAARFAYKAAESMLVERDKVLKLNRDAEESENKA